MYSDVGGYANQENFVVIKMLSGSPAKSRHALIPCTPVYTDSSFPVGFSGNNFQGTLPEEMCAMRQLNQQRIEIIVDCAISCECCEKCISELPPS